MERSAIREAAVVDGARGARARARGGLPGQGRAMLGRAIRGFENCTTAEHLSFAKDVPVKPIFTIHAGEYLVGSYIESKFKNLNVWLPTKETGIDLLVTDSKNKKVVSIQVKFSKDFLVENKSDALRRGLKAAGWWSLKREKILKSNADLWVFVLYSFDQKKIDFIIIPPHELLKRLDVVHKQEKVKVVQTYFYVTKKNKCWETRGLGIADQVLVAEGMYSNKRRDFTKYLNNWNSVVA